MCEPGERYPEGEREIGNGGSVDGRDTRLEDKAEGTNVDGFQRWRRG